MHVAVAHPQPDHQRVQGLGVFHGLCGRAHVGLGDDFQERRAGPVEVNAALALIVIVQTFARVFFEVRARELHRVRLTIVHEVHATTLHHGGLELADLVALGQIGVEVVFARKDRHRRDVRTERQAQTNGALDGPLVHHRQGAGQGQVHSAGLCIGRRAKGRAGATEDLAQGR